MTLTRQPLFCFSKAVLRFLSHPALLPTPPSKLSICHNSSMPSNLAPATNRSERGRLPSTTKGAASINAHSKITAALFAIFFLFIMNFMNRRLLKLHF